MMAWTFLQKNWWWLGLGCLFAGLFLGWTVLVRADLLNSWDFDVTAKVQYRVPIALDPYLATLSYLTNIWTSSAILAVFLLVVVKGWWHKIWVGSLFVGAHVIELIGKMILTHPNPPHLFYRSYTPFQLPEHYIHPGSSYPSGHSLRVVFLCWLLVEALWQVKSPKLSRSIRLGIQLAVSFGLVSFTVVTLVSRFSLGEHWPTDVVGGALLGCWIGAWGVVRFSQSK